jgi:hypothetical protein
LISLYWQASTELLVNAELGYLVLSRPHFTVMAKRRRAINSRQLSSPLALAAIHPYNTRCCKAIRTALFLQQHPNEPLLEVLQVLVDNSTLDVLSLVRLGCCSKACRSTAAALLENCAPFLLPNTVKLTASRYQERIKLQQTAI